MAHEFSCALQQAGRIRQPGAVKEPHVYVRSEYIDVAEGRISQTCNWTTVMQKLSDFVPAFSHHFKPLARDGSQFTSMLFHPRIDGGIPLDSTVESQQFRPLSLHLLHRVLTRSAGMPGTPRDSQSLPPSPQASQRIYGEHAPVEIER
jgi:hypothetical protein